jgi:hypothetical protein
MKWHRHTNYHSSRAYSDDPSDGASLSEFRVTFAWLADYAQRLFKGVLTPSGPSSAETIVLKMGSGRGFTVLGLRNIAEQPDTFVAPCPFPKRDDQPAMPRKATRKPPMDDPSAQVGGW